MHRCGHTHTHHVPCSPVLFPFLALSATAELRVARSLPGVEEPLLLWGGSLLLGNPTPQTADAPCDVPYVLVSHGSDMLGISCSDVIACRHTLWFLFYYFSMTSLWQICFMCMPEAPRWDPGSPHW